MNFPFAPFGDRPDDGGPDPAGGDAYGRVGDAFDALRQATWADGTIDEAEAEAIFHDNDEPGARPEGWAAWFLDSLTEYMVRTEQPHGYVSDERAQWLIDMLDRHGHLSDPLEMQLLVKVIDSALGVPAALRDYALAQVEQAVTSGEGPLREGASAEQGVTAAEAALIRRLVCGSGSENSIALSKAEAEMLFRIKDATVYEVNAPEWEEFFVEAVAGYLLGFDGPEPLSRERAAELEAFMEREGRGIGAFLARIGQTQPEESFASLLDLSIPVTVASEGDDEDDDDDAADPGAYGLPAEEAHWLFDALDADEDLDPLEKALIAYIAG